MVLSKSKGLLEVIEHIQILPLYSCWKCIWCIKNPGPKELRIKKDKKTDDKPRGKAVEIIKEEQWVGLKERI